METCEICGMEFEDEADLDIHHEDCEAELNERLDGENE